jgi:ER membrane protein SH3
MTAFVTAGAGFLLAVLWFDLMFDVQVLRNPPSQDALDSVSAYYGRVTTTARPMNLLVGAVMAGTLAALVAQVVGDDAPDWAAWASLALAGTAIGLAAVHTFPAARRLGAATNPHDVQGALAGSIGRDHLLCIAAISAVLVIQLAFAR